MWKKFRAFINTMILGGVTIIMPLVIIFMVFKWLFEFLTDLIQPLTNTLASYIKMPEVVADLLVVAVIIGLCFIFGMLERTKLGAPMSLNRLFQKSLCVESLGMKPWSLHLSQKNTRTVLILFLFPPDRTQPLGIFITYKKSM